jgi:hypothetical protein
MGRYSVREKVMIRTHPTEIPLHSTADGSSNEATLTTLATVLVRVPNLRRDGRKRVWKTCVQPEALHKDGRALTLSHCSGVPGSMRCAKVGECAMRGL